MERTVRSTFIQMIGRLTFVSIIFSILALLGCDNESQWRKADSHWIRKFDHIAPLDRRQWEDLMGVGPMMTRSQLQIETTEVHPISNKDALKLWDNLVRTGAITTDTGYRSHFIDGELSPFTRHRIVFTDKSTEATKARKSTRSSLPVNRLPSASDLTSLGLNLEIIAYGCETPSGWDTQFYDRLGQPTESPLFPVHNLPPFDFRHRGLPSLGLYFTKSDTSPIESLQKITLFDSHSKALLDRTALGESEEHQEVNLRAHFSSFPVFHNTLIDVVLDYRSSVGTTNTVVAPAEVGPVFDDGEGSVLACMAKGNPLVMKSWMEADAWGAFVSESQTMLSHVSPGFYFETWPHGHTEAFSIAFLAKDKSSVISSHRRHDLGEPHQLLYCVNDPTDFDRVCYFRIQHSSNHQRITFPINTAWLPSLPTSGDLFDALLPFATISDRRFTDWFMAPIAQIRLEGPRHKLNHGNLSAIPRDAESKTFVNITVREALEQHLKEQYPHGTAVYDSKQATLRVIQGEPPS